MTVTISRLYDDYQAAERAVRDLEAAGLAHSEISVVASNADNWYSGDKTGTKRVDRDADGVDDRAEGAGKGARVGAAIGGTAGLLAGLGLLAIPGVGPVVAAGWLVATAAGVAAGGATGGIIGALANAGVDEEDAEVYAEGVRRGGTLVTARVPDGDRSRYESILDRSAVNIAERGKAYRSSGWKSFDPNATPYNADQVRKERTLYGGRAGRVKTREASANYRSEPDPRDCPQCGARMRVEAESDDELLGPFGMKQHAMRCDGCGTTATRQYDPAKGYRK